MDREDTCTLSDGRVVRVVGNHVLVRAHEPPRQSKEGILFAGDAMTDVNTTGEVLAVGYVTAGAPAGTPIPGIKKGDQVVFVRFHVKRGTSEQLATRLEKDVVELRPSDIILVLDKEDLPRVRADLA